ncbi:recombination endonuclease VII [Streptomyces sp. Ag109_O5-1]|uniref:endonuclease domain-containing protein n=1 Tax=Streptomyces sp. Ag109_O5-1 TaxID=1938851 RepID=UPI000F4F64B9|nr:endonuclease domain-containing protein [Streptomyces sp. Ag109_O5-1]RPE39691.1 recombination endonuclease VII [Streptomyces sp. Ag109_O5-1]
MRESCCTKHTERYPNGQCKPCRVEASRRYIAKKRAERGDAYPCKQCWGPIPIAPKGGNPKRVCDVCAPDDRYRMLVQRYGVDKAMFEAMYFEQDGKCAIPICTREAVSVDHDHETGRVRGLVCQGCNIALGFLESASWVADARTYLADADTPLPPGF